jgi:hypothetical protein
MTCQFVAAETTFEDERVPQQPLSGELVCKEAICHKRLRRALKQEMIWPAFQPLVDLRSGHRRV